MKKRRHINRERLELYLVNLLLMYRPILRLSGLFFLIYAIAAWSLSPIAASISLGSAVFLILLSYSYHATLRLAKIGAWMGTIWQIDDRH